MKCIHHIDADGYGAAAIVRLGFNEVFAPSTEEDVIAYDHGQELKLPDPDKLRDGEEVYIVDLALDKTIMNAIKYFVEHNCHVIHIDHHIGGKRYYETMSPDEKAIYDSITHFFNTDYSGTMLTWVYACMTPEERHNPGVVEFDFTSTFDMVGFWFNTPNSRQIRIPFAIRYIDDNDVWRHSLEESKYFALSFNMLEDKSPTSDIWNDLIYSSTEMKTMQMVNEGLLLYRYQDSINHNALRNAFEYEIDGIKCLCLNAPFGNSRLFCEKYDEYPMVCKFSYDGNMGKWRYTFYSSDKRDDAADCAAIATKLFNGGGHAHAAGGATDELFFKKKPDNYVGNQ